MSKKKDEYHILIGIRRGEKLYEYIAGRHDRNKAIDYMHHIMRQKSCPYYLMAVHDCLDNICSINDTLTKANKDRGVSND